MSTDFLIQASCPTWTMSADPVDQTLCDAVQTVFPLDTEVALVVWRHVYVPLGYKYCVSFLVDDIIAMIERLTASSEGNWQLTWPSNEFAADWRFEWSGEQLRIRSTWHSVVGGTEEMLNQRSEIHLGRQEFLAEWKKLLLTVDDALSAAGYTEATLPRTANLKRAIADLGTIGKLYR